VCKLESRESWSLLVYENQCVAVIQKLLLKLAVLIMQSDDILNEVTQPKDQYEKQLKNGNRASANRNISIVKPMTSGLMLKWRRSAARRSGETMQPARASAACGKSAGGAKKNIISCGIIAQPQSRRNRKRENRRKISAKDSLRRAEIWNICRRRLILDAGENRK